ncbi:MAG: class I SAM-dependent methyltransferase [Thermoplasmata archaeon]
MRDPPSARAEPEVSNPFTRSAHSVGPRSNRLPPILRPAALKALRQRMLLTRQASLDRLAHLAGCDRERLRTYRQEIQTDGVAAQLLARGAGLAFVRELPQGPLFYLLVRALRPARVVETGVRPGYSTTWILAGLEANHFGELTSLGPGSSAGRTEGVDNVGVGQFVPPSLRGRWTLVLGNTEERFRAILASSPAIDLFFYDNGPDATRARFEIKNAWEALSERGVLLAHHVDASGAWNDFCALQGLPPQILDPGPPPLGALSMRRGTT